MPWPSKNPDDYVNPNPRFRLQRTERPAVLSYRDWKLMVPPTAMTFAMAPAWLGVIYIATCLGGVAVFELETPIFFIFVALWLAQFDALRFKGAGARVRERFPHPRASAFGSAPWGLLLGAQVATVLTFAILASTTSNDDGQLALVAAGLFAAFPVAWVLEWRIGRHERAAHAAASSSPA